MSREDNGLELSLTNFIEHIKQEALKGTDFNQVRSVVFQSCGENVLGQTMLTLRVEMIKYNQYKGYVSCTGHTYFTIYLSMNGGSLVEIEQHPF